MHNLLDCCLSLYWSQKKLQKNCLLGTCKDRWHREIFSFTGWYQISFLLAKTERLKYIQNQSTKSKKWTIYKTRKVEYKGLVTCKLFPAMAGGSHIDNTSLTVQLGISWYTNSCITVKLTCVKAAYLCMHTCRDCIQFSFQFSCFLMCFIYINI